MCARQKVVRTQGRGNLWPLRGLVRPPVLLRLAALMALALAAAVGGCGGGGGGGGGGNGAGTISGRVETQQVLAAAVAGQQGAPQGAPQLNQSLKVYVDGAIVPAVVQSDGTFNLPSVPAGTHTVQVRNADGSLAGYASVQVMNGMATAAVLTLLPAGQVAGIVSMRDSSGAINPVSGASVTLTAANNEVHPVPVFVPGQPPVTPPIPAGGPNQPAGSSPGGGGSPGAQTTGGQTTGGIPTGTPTTPLTLQTTTTSDGTYSFPAVPAGLYQVQATLGNSSANTIVAVEPAHTAAGDLLITSTVPVPQVQVSGTVRGKDASGQLHPIAGAMVQFDRASPCIPIAPGQPGGGQAGGGTVGGGQAGGSQTGTVPPGQTASTRHRQQPPPPCEVQPLPAAVPAGGAVQGNAAQGGAASGPLLVSPAGAVTDAQGNYTLSVPADTQNLVAEAPGFVPQSQHVTLSGATTVDFTLDPDPTALLQSHLSVDGIGDGPVTVAAGTPLKLTLTLTNTSSQAVPVKVFGAGDDVEITSPPVQGGPIRLLWTLHFGELQPDVVTVVTLQPGEAITRHETWPGLDNDQIPPPAGAYDLAGDVAGIATNHVVLNVTGA